MTQQTGLEGVGAVLLNGQVPAFPKVTGVEAAEQGVCRVGFWRLERGRVQGADVHQLGEVVEVAVGLFRHRGLDGGFLFFPVGAPA